MQLLLLTGCTTLGRWDIVEEDTGDPELRIVVSPAVLDFDEVSVNNGGITTRFFTIYNVGDTTEVLSGHNEPIGSDAFYIDAPPLVELDPGGQLEVEVRYVPTTEQSDEAELLVEPTNETVRLIAGATAPVVHSETITVDPVVLGCSGPGSVVLENHGSEPLEIDGATSSSGEFVITALPDAVAPGGQGAVQFEFTPSGGGARGTTILVYSNDPASPELGLTVSGLGYEGEEVTETFRFTPSNPTDILFAIETGDAMGSYGDRARAALATFVDTLRDANVDYHLAAVTSAGPCPSSTPGWAGRSDTSLQAETTLQRAFDLGDGPWAGDLVALAGEAVRLSERGECLVDFRREDADLAIILVADGPSDSDPRASALELETQVEGVVNFTISGLLPSDLECGSQAPDYAGVIESWGGRQEDLCAEDWTAGLTSLAALPATEAAVEFELAEAPVVSTISVLAEGATFSDWSWETERNAIVFDGENVPALGAEITIRYVSSVACD